MSMTAHNAIAAIRQEGETSTPLPSLSTQHMFTRDRGSETFTIASFESDFTGHLAVHSLFHRLQDIAGRHADFLDVGYEKLKAAGLAWLLSRIKVEIAALPAWGDEVTVETWPKGVDRLFALRDFRLRNAAGKTLALATTCWLLVDMAKERPRRVETLAVDLRFPNAEQALREIPDKLAAPGLLQASYQKQILPSDLDVNDHVNNAHYARWVTDCFDRERLAKGMKGLQLNYLEQARLRDRVAIAVADAGGSASRAYVEGQNTATGKVLFQALVEWE